MMLDKIVDNFAINPRRLFLIDGFGAMLSAVLLGVVLVRWENVFGIPPPTLYVLAVLPIFFAIYDFYNYLKKKGGFGQSLKAIALMNLLYCCLSIGLAFHHSGTITEWGWAYILVEVLIVAALAVLEIKVAMRV